MTTDHRGAVRRADTLLGLVLAGTEPATAGLGPPAGVDAFAWDEGDRP